jgi:ATP-binding cassette subfamily B protein
MSETEKQRDKKITREINRLFWKGNLSNPRTFIGWLLCRPPAIFIYNVLIPIQIAYGLEAIIDKQFDAVGHHAFLVLMFAITYCVLWGVGGVAICRNGVTGGRYVQKKVFESYLQKDYEFYGNTFIGALGSQAIRIRDSFAQYNQIMINALPFQFITVVCSIVVIGYHSLQVALVTVACMGLVLSYTVASSKWRLRFRRRLSLASSDLAGTISDALGQSTTVKSFAAEAYERERLDNSLGQWGSAQYVSWLTSIPSDLGRMLLAAGAIGVLLLLTAHLYQTGSISVAIVVLVQLYVVKLISTTQEISDTIKAYENAMGGSYDSIKTMLVEPIVNDQPNALSLPKKAQPSIEFDKVSFRYDKHAVGRSAVKDFSLHIKPGEKIGIVGYSGSGKTTLTKLLVRFMDIDKGAIHVAGTDIRDLKQHELRKYISYVPQEPLLFHRSILENVAYGRPNANKTAILNAAKAAYVDEFVDELPTSYDTLVGERGVKLSGGQRQRVAIARALLKDAPILVLDEATSALDSRSEQLIQKALWKLMQKRTALVIAHRLSTIQRMDRIAVMDKGKIVQIGTHEELLKDTGGIYAELWAHQSGGYVGTPDKEVVDIQV